MDKSRSMDGKQTLDLGATKLFSGKSRLMGLLGWVLVQAS